MFYGIMRGPHTRLDLPSIGKPVCPSTPSLALMRGYVYTSMRAYKIGDGKRGLHRLVEI